MGGEWEKFIWNGGGDTRWSSQMGGCIQAPPKMGGLMRGRRLREKGHPSSACFWHLPVGEIKLVVLAEMDTREIMEKFKF